MKKIVLSSLLSILFVFGINAQEKGDWYIGSGNIADKAWTEWSINPSVGYGVTSNLMVGMNISQADSTSDIVYDLHARYFWNGYFAYIGTTGFNTDDMQVGMGKMFTFHKGMYLDPKVVYNMKEKTTNLMLGVGLKF